MTMTFYTNDLTPSDYYLFWNLKSDNDGLRYRYFQFSEAISITNERGLSNSSEYLKHRSLTLEIGSIWCSVMS